MVDPSLHPECGEERGMKDTNPMIATVTNCIMNGIVIGSGYALISIGSKICKISRLDV
jgi:hypothetical protein